MIPSTHCNNQKCLVKINSKISSAPLWSISRYLHTQPFYSSLDFVWDNAGGPVPEGTFCHLLDFLEQNKDNTGRCTNNLDGLPPHPDNWCPHLCHPHHFFMQDALPYTTLPIYPGLGQAPNMLACIPGGLVTYSTNFTKIHL